MATIRNGNRAALVVVDTQVGVVAEAHDRDAIVGRIADLVARARAGGVPVVWVQHHDEELVEGSASWQLAPELTPLVNEARVGKSFNSSFQQTTLEDTLARAEVSQVVLCGAATNWCIRATAYSALERGYDLTLAGDAHTTSSLALGPDRTLDAADIIGELNVGLSGVSYPGVANQVSPTAQIGFVGGALQVTKAT